MSSSITIHETQSAPARSDGPGERPTFARENVETLKLAAPLIAGQLGQMLMGIVDTVMVGRVGVVALGAATFTNTILSVPYVLAIGLLVSVSVRVSVARGASDPTDAQSSCLHGTWMALAYGIALVALSYLGLPLLGYLGQPAEVVAKTPTYLLTVAISMVPALLSMVWKNHADALNRPWPPFWILLGSVGLNAFLNWLWIYGNWGFPACGLEGAGYATLVARTICAAALFAWMMRSREVRAWSPPRWFARCTRLGFRHLLVIGFPASLGLLTEVGAFSTSALIIGTLGTAPLAAHQVAITCAATTFMVPLGVAMALTVRVGNVLGAGQPERMHRILVGGWIFGVGFMSLTAITFLLAGNTIASWFITDIDVITITSQLLIVAGIFQIFDGLQVISAGALRGIGDVRVPALFNLLAYWGIALPVGSLLALSLGLGAGGMWTGLAVGLGVAALCLAIRAWRKLSQRPATA